MRNLNLQHYFLEEPGYHPFLKRPGWQVAQLNDHQDLHADQLSDIERHQETDEVFVLVRGRATLIEATVSERVTFACKEMEQGIVYNVPQGVWHAIRTEPGMLVIIVERDGTHLRDVEHRRLNPEEKARLLRALHDTDTKQKGACQ